MLPPWSLLKREEMHTWQKKHLTPVEYIWEQNHVRAYLFESLQQLREDGNGASGRKSEFCPTLHKQAIIRAETDGQAHMQSVGTVTSSSKTASKNRNAS